MFAFTDVRFFCELTLLETCADAKLKEQFWSSLQTKHVSKFINPRFLTGERWTTIYRNDGVPITATIFIDHKTTSIVVCFPGTNHARQLIAFLTLRSVSLLPIGGRGNAHMGFMHIYLLIHDALLAQLRLAVDDYPDYVIVMAGYSMGGALARLLFWEYSVSCKNVEQKKIQVLSWGAPRVFDTSAAIAYNSLVLHDWRYEMPGDRIVTLPPQWANFRHVGDQIIMRSPDIKEYNTRFDRLFAGVHQSYIPNMRFVLVTLLSGISGDR